MFNPKHLTFIGMACLWTASCQSVSRNKHNTPPALKTDPTQDLVNRIINDEVIPSLTTSRSALSILDALQQGDGSIRPIADAIADLEKSFKSAALIKLQDSSKNTSSSEKQIQFEIPFVSDQKTFVLNAEITKDRSDPSQITDSFGVAPKSLPDGKKAAAVITRSHPMLLPENSDHWVIDIKELNNFLKSIHSLPNKTLPEDYNIFFITSEKTINFSVTAPHYQQAVSGTQWNSFSAETDIKNPTKYRVRLRVKCKNSSLNKVVQTEINTGGTGIGKLLTDLANTKTDNECGKN
jgi:hypothetical protein